MAKTHNHMTKEMENHINVKDCWFDDKEGLFHCIMRDDTEWTSSTGSAQDEWTRIPKKGAVPPASVNDVTMDAISAMNLADQMSKSPWGDLPPTQQKIHEIMGAMKDLLLYLS